MLAGRCGCVGRTLLWVLAGWVFLECWQGVVVGVLTAETDDQRELPLVSNSAVQDVGTAVSSHGPVREDPCGRLLVSGLSVLPLY